jgi:hypothetical protein
MAGAIASLWGNENFERPALDFPAFVKGVALHDWGYGLIDNLPIGESPQTKWLRAIRRGVRHPFEPAVTDVIIKLHLRRLLAAKDTPPRRKLIAEVDALIPALLQKSEHPLSDFAWADRITNFCDYIAFYFAFEESFEKTFNVFSQLGTQNETGIHLVISGHEEIVVEPWPFGVKSYQGFIYAYTAEGYPQVLNPILLPYRLVQG